MARYLALLLIFCSVGGAAAEPAASATDVSLKVKPLLCIIDRQTPACDMSFLVAWQSATSGYYCLFNHFVTTPLRCWNDASAGQHEERRLVDRGFMFWLTESGNDEPLAAVTVEVMTTETTDRRRTRRTRHVWDLL